MLFLIKTASSSYLTHEPGCDWCEHERGGIWKTRKPKPIPAVLAHDMLDSCAHEICTPKVGEIARWNIEPRN